MECKNCGKQLLDDATFCTSCGWKTEKWNDEVNKSKNIHLGNILIVTVGSIVFILMLFLFLINI